MKDMRQALLDAGLHLINEHGFAGVGLMKIINEAEGTKGSFYHYFKSKEHFGAILLHDYFETHLERLERFLSDESKAPSERVQAYFDDWCVVKLTEDFRIQCLVVKLAGEVSGHDTEMQSEMAVGTKKMIEKMTTFFERSNQEGTLCLSAPEQTAKTLFSLWLGYTLLAAMQKDRAILDDAMQTTVKLLNE
ncbi:TetR/AcrR family transcriptional regulator [Vibrio owensii]|uniref:TetR/AcrR family transcriptional regulator n=1 Tax=Vibrio owensii TaxID=696485 RepID=UPI002FEE9F03